MSFSKNKGKRYEDKIAEKIAKSLKLDRTKCHRASFSGNSSWDFGDIYVENVPLVVECKNHESFDIRHLLSLNKTVKNWIEQLNNSAEKYKKVFGIEPVKILVMTKSYWPDFILIEKKYLDNISMERLSSFMSINKYFVFFSNAFYDLLPDIITLNRTEGS